MLKWGLMVMIICEIGNDITLKLELLMMLKKTDIMLMRMRTEMG